MFAHGQEVDTCAIVTVHQAGDVGLGFARDKMGWAEFLQHPVTVTLIDLSPVVDPTEKRDSCQSTWQSSEGHHSHFIRQHILCVLSRNV